MTQRWKSRPEGSNWGDFGPNDQLGRINLLTAEKVRQGVAEVREGLVFCLSLPLDYPGGNVLNPRRHPPALRPTDRDGKPNMNFPLRKENPAYHDVVCDDAALLHLQYSTQWDSLAHVGPLFDADGDGVDEALFYNGYRAGEHVLGPVEYHDGEETPREGPMGARALGIETMAAAGMQGRGVLLDLHAHFGDARQVVGYDDMMRVIDADDVEIEPGDMLCLHTGFVALLLEMNRQPDGEALGDACAALDGLDERLLRWITDSGIAALIADNYAVEHYPRPVPENAGPGTCAALPLHEHCLFRLGLPLAELWHLSELAAWLRGHSRHRFLLTAPPLRLPGAVGSPVTPIATV